MENVVDALKNPTMGPGGLFQGVLSTSIWLPVVDGVVIPKQTAELYASGAIAAKVPTILGFNLNEGTLFHTAVLGARPIPDAASYESLIVKLLGEETGKKAIALYPIPAGVQPDDVAAQLESDALFACPSRRMACALAKAGVSAFRYHFVRKPDNGLVAAFGATHGADVPFVFGNDDPILGGVSDGGMSLRESMMRYWTRFAAKGDPNGEPDVQWPRYDASSDSYLTLDTPPRAGTQLLADKCAFWDAVPPIAVPKTYAD